MRIVEIIDTIKIKIRRKYILKTNKRRKLKISNKNFTIISNNCWGGFVYQSYDLKYNSPTIGLYFMADDYLNFVSDMKKYIKSQLIFIKPTESKWYEFVKNNHNYGNFPVAKLNDIEIFFMHYDNEMQAQLKWDERIKRINYENILYKFSEMNNCTKEHLIKFQNLKLKNKICFISKCNKDLVNDYTIVVTKNNSSVKSFDEPIGNSKKININNVINYMERDDNL